MPSNTEAPYDVLIHSAAMMGSVVTIEVTTTACGADETAARIARAMEWFRHVERVCSRFDAASELSRLTSTAGIPHSVSPTLFEPLRFALALARETDGAFDPTVGGALVEFGFDTNFRTGQPMQVEEASAVRASYRDVVLDEQRHTVTVVRPLVLDLGAVAKGLAVDLAAMELAPCADFLVDAGGDVYASGQMPRGGPWRVGVRHPHARDTLLTTLRVSGAAVCTSGNYERTSPVSDAHVIDARTRRPARNIASATVVAPTTMVADALATAAMALGVEGGLALIESHEAEGLLVTPTLERHATRGLDTYA